MKKLLGLIIMTIAIHISNQYFGEYALYWVIVGIIVALLCFKIVVDIKKVNRDGIQ